MEFTLCYVFLIFFVVQPSQPELLTVSGYADFVNLLPIDNYTDDYVFKTTPKGTEISLKIKNDVEFSRHFLVTAVFTVNKFNSQWKLFTMSNGAKRILGISFNKNSEGVTLVELAINRRVFQYIIQADYSNNMTRLIFDVSGNEVKLSINCRDMFQTAVTPTTDLSNSKPVSLPKDNIHIKFAASDSNLKGTIKELKVFPYASSETQTVICDKYDAVLASNEAAEEDRQRVEEIKNIVRTIPELKGPAGERGPPGIDGKKGEPGLKGEVGPKGLDGINGTKGEKGEVGEKGSRGIRGPRGDRGIQGQPGQPGLEGVPGGAGPPGPAGKAGETGPQGERGFPGENGKPGKDGSPAEKGATGPKGERGEKGSTGVPGPMATLSPEEKQLLVKDLKGEKGERGEQGKQGNDGKLGQDGKDGSPGETGSPGPRGEPGPIGPKGDEGEQGPVGKAIKGDKGELGHPGKNGTAGPRGEKGDKGNTGAAGPKGDTGNSGPPGLIGPMGPPGYNGTNGEDGQPCEDDDPIDLLKLKGEKGDQGVAGKDGRPGEDGKPGEHGKMGHKGNQGPQGPRGPPGPPGSVGPRGEPGLPGIAVQGQKGEKGDSYFNELSVTGYLHNEEDFIPVNTFVYATRKGLIKYNHLRVNGTMAYIEQEKKLLIKINDNTWNEIMMRPGITIGSPPPEPSTTPKPTTTEATTTTHPPETSTLLVTTSRTELTTNTTTAQSIPHQKPHLANRTFPTTTEATTTTHIPETTPPLVTTTTTSTTARPTPHQRPHLAHRRFIRLIAFNESHDGLIGQKNEDADRKCFRLSNALIHHDSRFSGENRLHAKVFRASGFTSLKDVIPMKYWQLPVGNLFNRPSDNPSNLLFKSWESMFYDDSEGFSHNGHKRVIFSFSGNNVLSENKTWPEKKIWGGINNRNYNCKDWTTNSPHHSGIGFSLDSNFYLGSEQFPCNKKLIVLCVLITELKTHNPQYKRNDELNISNYITRLQGNGRRFRRRHSRSRSRQPSLNRLDRK